MQRGPWHQLGDRSQLLALEQIVQGVGVGVIISPCNLPRHKAIEYAQRYHGLNAHVLIDQQFYEPGFTNLKLETYPICQYRTRITQSNQVSDADLETLARELYRDNQELSTDGLVAPARAYEAGRPDIVTLNTRLFNMAKSVGDALGIPTYATVMLGRSSTSSDETMTTTLSQATSLQSDGFYFGYEFSGERIPSSREAVLRCSTAGLVLVCTGKPVLHAFAGPMALLSMGFGATGTAVGHFQNLWQFSHSRWTSSTGEGGGGEAPPRFFSRNLWGTIVYPDEVARIDASLRSRVITHSPFSTVVSGSSPSANWSRWDSYKHLVYIICTAISDMAAHGTPQASAQAAITLLQDAVNLHNGIANSGIALRDNSNAYQQNWIDAVTDLLTNQASDFEYLDILS